MVKHLDITIHGQVQAVGFRYYTKQTAESLGIKGIVQNQLDGTVRVEAEGEENALQKLLEWCKHGPSKATIDKVGTSLAELKNYQSFEIV